MAYLELVGGLILLVVGGDSLVRGGVALARHFGVSPLLIGLTLVGFGTSTPELVTSLEAALAGSPGIAIGNVVGSNTANILLILGLAALLRPIATNPTALRRDGPVMMLAALLCLGVVLWGTVERYWGAVFIALLAAYVIHTYLRERQHSDASAVMHTSEAEAHHALPQRLWVSVLLTAAGFGLTILGAKFLVGGAVDLAAAAGVSETLIGLTIVAVGTSLPELVTSVVATLRREGDVALGNVVGSNIYNILGILGVTALVEPIAVPAEIVRLDIWVMLAATIAMLFVAATGKRISRIEGGVLMAGYGGYLAVLIANA